jgi:hypothetical protein
VTVILQEAEESNLIGWLSEFKSLEIKFMGGVIGQLETVNAWVQFT